MGFVFSRPAAPAPLAPGAMDTLTIRNLTVTPLELTLVERIARPEEPPPKPVTGLARITARLTGLPQQPEATQTTDSTPSPPSPTPSASQPLQNIPLDPFTERLTPVYPPDPQRPENLRLTFAEPGTSRTYAAEIPGSVPRTIVLKPNTNSDVAIPGIPPPKEFSAVWIPSYNYLALFSSADLSSWMDRLSSSLPLSALSIPGTHNSPAHYLALPSVRCQAVSIREQLENGVRFLDIRVSCPDEKEKPPSPPASVAGDQQGQLQQQSSSDDDSEESDDATRCAHLAPDLALVHSAFPVSLSGPKYLHTLLQTCRAFLRAHPTETILISLKREGTGRGTDQLLSRYLSTARYCGRRRDWYTGSAVPTLGAVRGKMVLVRRFVLDPSVRSSFPEGFGIDGSVWPDNVADATCGAGTIRIQDFYEVGQPSEIDKKAQMAKEQLERCATVVFPPSALRGDCGQTSPLFINFLSASNFFNASCWPDRIAVRINPTIIEYLCMGHGANGKGPGNLDVGDAATGIVVTDWVGNNGDWDLIRCIVGWNARLQLKQ